MTRTPAIHGGTKRLISKSTKSAHKERLHLRTQQLGRLLRNVVASRHRATDDGAFRSALPISDRSEKLVHDASLTPQNADRALDAIVCLQVSPVVLEIDRRGGTIVFAHRVDCRRRKATLILSQRSRIEQSGADRSPATELVAKIKAPIGPNQRFRQ